MKRIVSFGLVVAVIAGFFWVYSLAQTAGPQKAESKLEQAKASLRVGKLDQAREVLATITVGEPDFAAAKFYDAFARSEANDHLGFLNALEKLSAHSNNIPPELETELTVRQIEALSFYRKFEEFLPKALTFLEQHADSPDASVVREYLMSGLFERGLKKTFEAGKLKDEQFQQRWTEARENLEQFLALVAAFPMTNYTALPKRNLHDDLWKARVILGDETAALAEITPQNAAEREKFSLLRVLLYPKIQPTYADMNLHRMSNFLAEFPETKSWVRVEFEMANVNLFEGERLAYEAEGVERAGEADFAAQKRAAAAPYLARAQELFPRVVETKEAGIGWTERLEARVRMIRVFYAQRDWDSLSARAAQLLADKPEEKEWLVVRLYEGAALARQRKLPEAVSVLDEVLTIGFRNTPSYDGLLISAARWRIHVAQQTGDVATIQQVAELVRKSNCYGSIKRTFLEKFVPRATQSASVTNKTNL